MGNLSPYSYFGVMSHDPPYVTIGTCATGGRPNRMKDSQQNILETRCASAAAFSILFVPLYLFAPSYHVAFWLRHSAGKVGDQAPG